MLSVPNRRGLLALAVIVLCGGGISFGQIIVDNGDPEFSVLQGSWGSGTYGNPWGSDYNWVSTTSGSPTARAEWRPNLPSAGWYHVETYYVDGTNRTDNAPFTIYHAAGADLVRINQKTGGEQWVSLGVFEFNAGTGGSVELANDATSSVAIADAVRFVAAGPPEPELRGMWADAFHEGFKSAAQVDAMVARALAGNYNAIFPEILAYHDNATSAHGAYWNSAIVPKAPDIAGGFDPLAYLVQQAHGAGIEVHPWLVTYRVSTSWPPAGNTIIASNPEWISVLDSDMGSGPQPVGGHYLLDPGSPDVQEYLISIVREIVTNYEVDGIHWDYIRYTTDDAGYPAYTWYDNSGLERFKRITGYVGTPGTNDSQWDDFRRREVTELVRRAMVEVAIADNPRQPLRHTAALITQGGAPTNFEQTASWSAYFQDWKLWMDESYLDAAIPMTYYDENVYPAWYRDWVDQALIWVPDRHVFTGPGIYKNTFADSATQIDYARSAGADGIVTYSYAVTSSAGVDWTWYNYTGSNIFTTPAPLPDMPWRDPATATRGAFYGRVADGATGEPIDDASIYLNGFYVGETDGNGFFVVTELNVGPNGSQVAVSASAPGYTTVARPNVLLQRAGYTEVNLGFGAWLFGDSDVDSDVDGDDWAKFDTVTGPDGGPPPAGRDVFDADQDDDIDLFDVSMFQEAFGA